MGDPVLINELTFAIEMAIRNFHWIALGVILGMIMGSIPGLGGSTIIILMLPFSLGMDSFSAFALFAAAMGAASFSGSITAILINTPGTAGNAATLLDGYPLTQKGESARAISASATASALGATIGIFLFILLIPVILDFVLLFGPSEVFWMVLIGLAAIPLITKGKILAGLTVGGIGLLFSFVGTSVETAERRFTFDNPFLYEGIDLIPALIGLFALAEVIKLATTNKGIVKENATVAGNKLRGVRDVISHKILMIRCAIIGTFIGAIPGVGGSAATFIAYAHAMQTSSNPGDFSKGNIEGVIASESANDAKDGGQLFPTLGLGIPGSGSAAVLLAALLVHGITPSPRMLVDHLDLMLLIAVSLFFSNILTSIIGLTFTRHFTYILKVPISIIFPVITAVSLMAVFISRNAFFDIIIAIAFGVLGVILMYVNITRIPIIIALVLGGIMETNFFIALSLADGSIYNAFFTGYLNNILILLLISSLLFPIVKPHLKRIALA